MRVGLFTDAYLPDINGVVSSVQTLKESLEKIGHTVYVVSNHKGTSIEMEDHVLRLPGIELKGFYGYKMSSPIQFEVEKYIRKMNLDVIHVQTEAGIGIFARHMAKTLQLPLVYTYHTMYEDYTHYLNPMGLKSIDNVEKKIIAYISSFLGNGAQAVIAPSEKTRAVLQSYGVKTPIYVVPTGLDIEAFNREKLDQDRVNHIRGEYGLTEDDHVVVFVGRIAKEKMIDMLIEAVSYVTDEKIKLIIVGGGVDDEFYHDVMKKFKVEDKVIFAGRKPKEDIPYYYAAFDCFASASTTETQGMTYIEALATGLCVFGRRDPVLDELVFEDQTGYYFDDAKELSQKLDYFFKKSPEERISMREACIEKTSPYKTSTFAHKAHAVYQQALSDYKLCYTVEGIQFEGDFVKLSLYREFGKEIKRLVIPPNEFFDMKLEIGTKVDSYVVDSYESLQDYYQVFSKCKQHILRNDYTSTELLHYCIQKQGLLEDEAEVLVETFKKRGWIDDEKYALNKAEYWHSSGYGKREIQDKLRKKGISDALIERALQDLDQDTERLNAEKLAKKLSANVKEKSRKLREQRIVNKLIQKGYDYSIAQETAEHLDFSDSDDEAVLLAYRKAQRLYKNEENDVDYRRKIRKYLRTQGFESSLIDDIMED
ncbi:MAG: RecX family transcriptional regulator [Firmicutes bacterium]|nr:RecX family transcriptional regulator [Bacillota bacterium]